MKLDRIPPRMLLVLGLAPACGPSVGDDETTAADTSDGDSTRGPGSTNASTSGPSATSSSTAPSTTGMTGSGEVDVDVDVGPCLEPLPPETTSGTSGTGTTSGSSDTNDSNDSVGPCLDLPPTTGFDSGGGETFTPCLAPPGDEPASDGPGVVAPHDARATDVLDRVLSSRRLPDDVAARLKHRR